MNSSQNCFGMNNWWKTSSPVTPVCIALIQLCTVISFAGWTISNTQKNRQISFIMKSRPTPKCPVLELTATVCPNVNSITVKAVNSSWRFNGTVKVYYRLIFKMWWKIIFYFYMTFKIIKALSHNRHKSDAYAHRH